MAEAWGMRGPRQDAPKEAFNLFTSVENNNKHSRNRNLNFSSGLLNMMHLEQCYPWRYSGPVLRLELSWCDVQ